MLHKCDKNELLKRIAAPLDDLIESDFNFKLTGSHRFGRPKPGADFNFYAQLSEEVKKWLSENGFEEMPDGHVPLIPGTILYCQGNVNVQLHQDAERFDRTNRWFEKNMLMYHYLKSLPGKAGASAIWGLVYEITKTPPPPKEPIA